MKKIINKHMIILFALVASILLMTTMYAAINSVTGDIRGKVIADKQTGVYITDVQYVSDIDADLGVSTIKNYKGTFMQNTVKLSSTNSASEIKYKVTVYNSSDKSYPFLAVLYDEEFYDNLNIIFEISSEGYKIGDIINPHEIRDIFIIFKYKDGQIPQNTTLNANLNFKIANPNRMVLAQNVPETGNYLGSAVVKNKIETIRFELGKIEPQGTISSFDASEKQDGSIMGYYTDANNDGLYDLTFASYEPIYGNANANYLFSNLTNLKDISFNNFRTSGVTGMRQMFYRCINLTSLDVNSFNTSQVTNIERMFCHCESLTNLEISEISTEQVTNMYGTFYNCKQLKNINISNFNTSRVTNMGLMFENCSSLENIELNGFNTEQVTNMEAMFANCNSVANLDVSSFNTSNVTNMRDMFYSCNKLKTINVSKFDTSKVTNMQGMFNGCRGITILDLSKFNTFKVTNMSYMFGNCTNLEKIYVSEFNPTTNKGWTTSAVINSADMFIDSTKLVGGNGTKYDANHIDKEYARIDKAGAPGYLTDIKDKPVSPSEIFDKEGTNPDGLHIGDFVNYDAGTWTQEEINEIKTGEKSNPVTANGSTELPTQSYQFGGFTAGSSRNGNATPWTYTDYNQKKWGNYVKDKSTNQPITGWRVFDVEGDRVTLISSGNPEMYRHYYREAYQGEYILTGNVNSSWENGETESAKYQKRDWSKYVNSSQKAQSARPITKSRLDSWYTKYTNTPNADTYDREIFQKIYQGPYIKYQSVVDNGSYYWLSSARNLAYMYNVDPYDRYLEDYDNDYGFGVRVLVSLKSEVRFTPQKVETKTVTGENSTTYGGDQTYNVWGIAGTNTGEDKEPPIAGTMTMKLDNANGAEYVNNTTTERNVYIAVNNGYDTAGGSGHKSTTYTVLKDGATYLSNQTGSYILTVPGTYTITVTTTDNAGNVATRGGYVVKKIEAGKSPSQLFDQAGTNPDGLHIGDFVNYDAGIWTQEEINEIKTGEKSNLVTANGSTELPTQGFQFGGFTAGSSRNGNATPWIYTFANQRKSGNYVKDKSTNQPITGWRVFDVEGDRVTLISAGNPEDYYHKSGTDSSYISEYILIGNVNSSWRNGATEAGNYQKRDWSKYVNTSQKAESAKLLTKKRLDSWYTKYTNTVNASTNDDATFRKIYQGPYTKYQSVVDNGSYYWFSTASYSESVFYVDPGYRYVSNRSDKGLGVRVLVSLKSEVKFTPQKVGTKTVTGENTTTHGGDQTYNVWGIAGTAEDKEPPIAGTMIMKLDNANGAEYVNNTTTERNVYIAVNNGEDNIGGSGHKSTTYTVLKDGTTYLENQIGPNTLTEPGTYTITVTTTDNAGNVATRGGYVVKIIEKGSPSSLFDPAGTNPDGLHIGDFVNYDAGTWTQEEINEIKTGEKSNLVTANGSTARPTQSYQFGGFTAGSSRNGNATPWIWTDSNTQKKWGNYVKDKSTNQPIIGWRVFDVEGDRVTLISAGNPEDYYHPYRTNYAYISEYILTGNINSSWTNGATVSAKYQKRDWSKYVNTEQKAQSATPITKSRLDSWYTKYTNTPNANTYTQATFRKIYQGTYTKYQSIVDNGSYYWLSAAISSKGVYRVYPYDRIVGDNGGGGLGVRLLVSLKSEVRFTPQKLGTKTVTGENTTTYGGDQTYNVWGIAKESSGGGSDHNGGTAGP